ncbi:hypothetical protein ACPOL_6774 (plasmid) [Acidisarcina polymorpha]|uniref:Uncharacterized protein n=1 Tax=Acidisarcina polymorpha TaxID=2211140 RepID=A0A2Z5GB99_9BACT|nr:hypothetical protein [Acidisarcina polymorpha]AXC15984.1 hypothetical protein ACPOL_6774 [Acidisarcina polymorpha]
MPLLDIKLIKKLTVLCTLEESTVQTVDQYAAFAKAPADEVVNKAIEYALGRDSEFQKYRAANPKAPAALRVKTPSSGSPNKKRGPKPASLIAAD